MSNHIHVVAHSRAGLDNQHGSVAYNDRQKLDTGHNCQGNGITTWIVNTGISPIQYNLLNLPEQIMSIEG